MMMLLAFPTSYMTFVWRQMRVSASAWLQPSTSMVYSSLHHLQRGSVDIRQDRQHRYDVRVSYVRMPAPSTHSVGM